MNVASNDRTSDGANVISLIQADHRAIEALLDQVADAADPERARAFDELAAYIERHEAAEQAVVHAELRHIEDDVADEREAEEAKGDRVLAQLRGLEVGSAEFDELFESFRRAVLDHAEHEESEEHPLLEQAVKAERLEEMADQFIEAERQAPSPS